MAFPKSYYTNQARHKFYCSCGKIVSGNGGRSGHFSMHERRQDGHRRIGQRRYDELFPSRQ